MNERVVIPLVATGFAVVVGAEIRFRTVSPTRIAAIVDWLCTECRLMVPANCPDGVVEHFWDQYSAALGARMYRVSIQPNQED